MDRRPPFPPDFRLLVASQSPRRHSLLRDIGVPFVVVPSVAEETLGPRSAAALAERNALAKVNGAILPVEAAPGTFVLGTDTLVTAGGRVMGKPDSTADAGEMLAYLEGRTHRVVSAVALSRIPEPGGSAISEHTWVANAKTDVTFVSLQKSDIDAYVASGEWKGKAGAYAIQGLAATYVSRVRGEYSNVVGLPLCLLARMFREAGFDLVRRVWL